MRKLVIAIMVTLVWLASSQVPKAQQLQQCTTDEGWGWWDAPSQTCVIFAPWPDVPPPPPTFPNPSGPNLPTDNPGPGSTVPGECPYIFCEDFPF